MAKKIYTKEQILEVAYQISRDKDIEKLSMRAIARQIGCSVMPIYDSFDSKEDLIYEVNKYSLHKTLYDLSHDTIEEYYDAIVEYGFHYPKFFLHFVRFEKSFIHDDVIVCKLCGFLKKDKRLKDLEDKYVIKLHGRMESFITGMILIYHQDSYSDTYIRSGKIVTRDTLDAFITHIAK